MTKGTEQRDDLSGTETELRKERATEEAKAERSSARGFYLLSLLSPLLLFTGPVVCLLPVVMLVLLVFGFRSRYAFVRWHTGQWALLTLVALSLGVFDTVAYSGGCLALIGIGGWCLGNVMGLRQANRGDCWLWGWLVPTAELPRPWATPSDALPAPTAAMLSAAPGEMPQSPALAAPASDVPAEPHAVFDRGRSLVRRGQQAEAVACFLVAFRGGPPELRRRAVDELEKLGEVETF